MTEREAEINIDCAVRITTFFIASHPDCDVRALITSAIRDTIRATAVLGETRALSLLDEQTKEVA